MNFYQFIIPRLDGGDIEKDFDHYLGLVKKGIAGFIIFGGELDTVRKCIKELQKEAKKPLIIASDLEQGLGQQIAGGTIFPPAMAIASAIKESFKFQVSSFKLKLLEETFKAIAIEARYAGINTIFAPVLDINTNPKNPIISTRSFGEDAETVSFFGSEMIKIFQANGIAACGKHFPGHGDTEIDSHIRLPLIKKDMQSLKKTELVPFKDAIKQGVKMIMLGHLKVPALDTSGISVSLSEKAVRYLRDNMKFEGVIITDALNMHALYPPFNSPLTKGGYRGVEERASLMALEAGVDLLLHPTDVEKIVSYLEKTVTSSKYQGSRLKRISELQRTTRLFPIPDFESHRRLAKELAERAIKVSGEIKVKGRPYLVVFDDERNYKGNPLIRQLKKKFPNLNFKSVNRDSEVQKITLPENSFVIVAVFSSIKAWKGGPSPWLIKCMQELEPRAKIFVSFGSPYILDEIRDDITKIYAYWDSDAAQKAVAEVFREISMI